MVLVANALTTVDTVKSYLKIDPSFTVDDSRIEMLINACSSAIENFCRRTFNTTLYTDEEYDGNNTRYINLENYPVSSISQVTVNGVVISSDQYKVKSKTGVLARVGPYPNTFTGLSMSRFNTVWNRGDANILVTYTAGYDVIPPDLEQACILYVMSFYKSDVANFSTTFTDGFAFKADAIPVQVKLMLQPYCKVL